jgi:hypothetical protein
LTLVIGSAQAREYSPPVPSPVKPQFDEYGKAQGPVTAAFTRKSQAFPVGRKKLKTPLNLLSGVIIDNNSLI